MSVSAVSVSRVRVRACPGSITSNTRSSPTRPPQSWVCVALDWLLYLDNSGVCADDVSTHTQHPRAEACLLAIPSAPPTSSSVMDDLRFRSQRSPRDDSNNPATMSLVTPPRNGSRMPQPPTPQQQHFAQQQHQQLQQLPSAAPGSDVRSNLPRRFTTESGRIPTLSTASLMSPPQRGPEPTQEYGNVSCALPCSSRQADRPKEQSRWRGWPMENRRRCRPRRHVAREGTVCPGVPLLL